MLGAFRLSSQSIFQASTRLFHVYPFTCYPRFVSTTAAINKGIRKTQRAGNRDRPSQSKETFARRNDRESRDTFTNQSRGRLNYLHAKDGRGLEQSTFSKRVNRTSSQPSQHDTSRRPDNYSGKRLSDRRDYDSSTSRGYVSYREQRKGGSERFSSKTNTRTSSGPTRAERRAAIYGHESDPPEGYKGLKRTSDRRIEPSPSSQNTVKSPHYSRTGRHNRFDETERPSVRHPTDQNTESSSRYEERDLPRRGSNVPLTIPYTTPASEFLYGHAVVTAALKSSCRKLYKLYLYNEENSAVRGQDQQVRKLALAAGVAVTRVGHDWLRLLDKASKGRPHNVRRDRS